MRQGGGECGNKELFTYTYKQKVFQNITFRTARVKKSATTMTVNNMKGSPHEIKQIMKKDIKSRFQELIEMIEGNKLHSHKTRIIFKQYN